MLHVFVRTCCHQCSGFWPFSGCVAVRKAVIVYLRKEETEAHRGSVTCPRSCREWQHRVPTLDDVGLKPGGLPATPPAEPRATLVADVGPFRPHTASRDRGSRGPSFTLSGLTPGPHSVEKQSGFELCPADSGLGRQTLALLPWVLVRSWSPGYTLCPGHL